MKRMIAVLLACAALVAGADLMVRLETPVGATFGSKAPGFGIATVVTGSDPAAGAEISVTVPAGEIWRVISARATLVSDATVANRTASLTFDDGTSVYFGSGTFAQTASQTGVYNWGNSLGAEDTTVLLALTQTIPQGLLLTAGSRIRTVTTSIQAGDNWSAPVIYVEKYSAY